MPLPEFELALAALSARAAKGPFERLLHEAVSKVAEVLDIDCCSVFELIPSRGELWRRAIAGRATDPLTPAILDAGPLSQAGYTLSVAHAVVAEDIRAEDRFWTSKGADIGFASAITVMIGSSERPYGVLGAFSYLARRFTDDEIGFLTEVAAILTAGFLDAGAGPAPVNGQGFRELVIICAAGEVSFATPAVARLMAQPAASLLGRPLDTLVEEQDRVRLQQCFTLAEELGAARLPVLHLGDGERTVPIRDVLFTPLVHAGGPAMLIAATEANDVEREPAQRAPAGPSAAAQSEPARLPRPAEDAPALPPVPAPAAADQKPPQRAETLRAVGQLASGVAHDFNNLLTIILLNAQLARSAIDPADHHLVAMLDQIETAGIRGAALSQRVLGFLRRPGNRPNTIDVNKAILGILPMLRRMVGARVEITTALTANPWTCLVDRSEFDNALINVVSNARDAMQKGGRVAISTTNRTIRPDEEDPDAPPRPGNYIGITVTDSGTGMSPDMLKRVFQPFFTTKLSGKGTGLGLSTVNEFVQRYDGHVAIRSAVGVGTTVSMFFPRAGEATAEPEHDRAIGPQQRGQGERILVVEDEAKLRAVTGSVLSHFGYSVLEANNAQQALALVRNEETAIDLVITDVVMPGGLDGWDLARTLLRHRPKLPILFITGYSDHEIIDRATLDPRIRVILKPFGWRDMLVAVRQAIDAI